jgi:signal transduction histidine kinase
VLGLALSLLLGVVCGVLVARYVGLKVRAISEVATRIGGGDMDQRVPVRKSGDAFEMLGQQINAMLDRIARLMDELRMLTDTLAHDLRSPIGRLRSAADAAIAARSQDEREQLLGNVIQESDSLMRILTTILEIGRTESFAAREQFKSFDAAELGAELAEMYEPLVEEAGATIAFEKRGGNFDFRGHRQLLAQALSNLIENAVNYAASGGAVTVFVEQQKDRLLMGVADRGPGIPAEQREQACSRFGRLDSSRSRSGAGLGLTLVRSIAHLHSGELVLDDAAPGLVATLDVPNGGPKG